MTMDSSSIRALTRFVRKLHLKSNSFILIQQDAISASEMDNLVASLDRYFKSVNVNNVFVLRIRNLDDVEILDEEQMSKYGWVRKERIQNSILKLLQKQEKPKEEEENVGA